jgi:hypothetical protein
LAQREVDAVTLHGGLLLLPPQLAIDIASTSSSISPTAWQNFILFKSRPH